MQEKCSERHVTFQVFAFSEFAATFKKKNNNKTTKTKKDETFFYDIMCYGMQI